HVLERPADFLATGVGHHAEAAVLAAAFHDRDECAGPIRARLGQAVELLDLRKADIDLGLPAFAAFADHLGQAMQRLRAEHQVHVGRAFDDGRAFLAGHAAAHADQHRLAVALERLPATQPAEDLVLRSFAN